MHFFLSCLLATSVRAAMVGAQNWTCYHDHAATTEAVFIPLRASPTECNVQRLIALARSAQRTVVLLLPQPNASLEHRLRQDYSLDNLIIQPNPEGVDAPWMSSFAHATMRSGVSKGAFITWLASQKRFTRAWHIEEDVLFTGRWHELFDAYVTSPADLVANIQKIHPGWAYEHSCKVRADLPCYPHGVQTPGVDGLVTAWPAMRLSAALAHQLCSSLQHDGATGHHEALPGPICQRLKWCKLQRLSKEHVAETFALGGSNKALSTTTWQQTGVGRMFRRRDADGVLKWGGVVLNRTLYHPIKCGADLPLNSSTSYHDPCFRSSACVQSRFVNQLTTKVSKCPDFYLRRYEQPLPLSYVNTHDHWLIEKPLLESRRNHDCIVIEKGGQTLINILGRWARSVETLDLITGATSMANTSSELDPAGYPLNNLNHVYAVPVSSQLEGAEGHVDEIWLPCGFHGDEVNSEISSHYARIIDLSTLRVRLGPRLLRAGGACSAQPIRLEGPGTPAHVCSFGGTEGSHDKGKFLDTVACYDRRANVWNEPFGKLPIGLDHSNAAIIPAGTCSPKDDTRVLLLNFRTRAYGGHHPEVLAHDMPKRGLGAVNMSGSAGWYVFANHSDGTSASLARDASGLVVAEGGRWLINYGGVHYVYPPGQEYNQTLEMGGKRGAPFSDVRIFDVCGSRKWHLAPKQSHLGLRTFAMQTCASKELGVAFTCGGQAPYKWHTNHPETHINLPFCIANPIPKRLSLKGRRLEE
jgi:hypothetical protein